MANPPATPPASDIDGVHEDKQRIDTPANADPAGSGKLAEEHDQNKARPKPSRA